MTEAERERATHPEDLGRLFLERARAKDVEGLVALYEPEAVLAPPGGQVAVGCAAIRAAYRQLLAVRSTVTAESQSPALVSGDLR